MKRPKAWLLRAAQVSAGITLVWIAAAQVQKTSEKTPEDSAFKASVQPFLLKNCVGCHNAKMASSGLNLEKMADPGESRTHPEIWIRVFDRVSKSEMPPPGMPRPSQADVAAVT